MTVVCLAARGDRSDLPEDVDVLVLPPPRTGIIPGATNPFAAAHGSRIVAVRKRVAWLFAYFYGLREWGRLAVEAAGHVDAWHAHDLTGLAAIIPRLRDELPLFTTRTNYSWIRARRHGCLTRFAACSGRSSAGWYRERPSVITVNDEIAAVIRRRYRPAEIVVVHNCPDLWVPPPSKPTLIREAAAIPLGAPIILYHGGLTGGRGIEQLMEALLVTGLEDIHLVLMGYGDKRDEFRSTARSARWMNRIHVLDPVPPSVLLAWVASADVGAMPNPGMTRNDMLSSPNKLFECLAAGTPVIVNNFPTMRRIVVDDPGGPLGAVCDPSGVQSIADAILSVLSRDPADMDVLRTRCLRAAAERWNWDQESETLLAVYSRILRRGG